MPGIPAAAVEDIIRAGRRMDAKGWVPATAGNISVRIAGARIAITRSGGHKGYLDPYSVIEVDALGQAINPGVRPSAETGLHCQIYRRFPKANAVLHGHSVAGTALSMTEPGHAITLAGYEMFKAFDGQTTHDVTLDIPVVDNDQDMARLAGIVEPLLDNAPLGYLIRGHGVYIWGADMDGALARLEGLEFLLACELERRRLA